MKLVIASILIISNCFVHVSSTQINTGGPKLLEETEDALLTCVVLVPNNNETVIWKRGQSEVLTAGLNRVTNDRRFAILHDEDTSRRKAKGDVWVLLIRNTKPNDTGLYTCEVNVNPVLRSFHYLRVRSSSSAESVNKTSAGDNGGNSTSSDYFDDLLPPNVESESIFNNFEESQLHSYEECCKFLNVSSTCLGFCTLQNILNGTAGVEPELCEEDFPKIITCMADGRNHVPCCESRKVPDICTDICHGDYTPFNDKLKSRISCSQYTVPSLECILEGVRRIPSQPTDVFVDANENSMKILWGRPKKLDATVKAFNINVTVLDSFDEGYLQNNTATTISIKVPGEMNETIVRNLRSNTMYSVVVSAENEFGSSLPSDRKRVFTLKVENANNRNNSIAVLPKLPDIKKCCVDHGLNHKTCLDKMCDPSKSDLIEVPDMMICAAWTNISFPCLTNGLDHKPCCKARGIPDLCLPFCDGTLKTINFNHFRCLQYMSDYSGCLMQGYGVLSSAPLRPKAELISDNYAIINWQKPMILSETVTKYHLRFRKLQSDESYSVIEETRPPIILGDLDPNTNYETYLTATNQFGTSSPSNRLVFKTRQATNKANVNSDMSYNITTCCRNSGLLPKCMNLCSYDIKMSDLQSLGHECLSSVGAIVRCASGGRDHRPCCSRRGVSKKCLANCKGILTDPTECVSYAGNIIQCFEEGNDVLPGPVENLQARIVDATSIYLSWQPNDNDTTASKEYLVQYGKVDNMTMYETILKLENEINSKDTETTLQVKPDTIYRIVVLSKNEYGTSLPSSELIINTSSASVGSKNAVSSPPHSLVTTSHGATFLTVSWLPPEFLHPNDKVSYRLYHRNGKNNVTVVDTKFLWVRMNRLLPRSQHIIYVVAVTSNGYSLPSETLIAWTDPAIPAIVDPPTVQPPIISEGSSINILCIALGNPLPNVKLYVGGHFVREDRTRHLVTTIHNVTRDMTNIACYADNGYGTASQASSRILINYLPQILPIFIPFAELNDEVEVKCKISAQPRPTKIMFWRDFARREPVINSETHNISLLLDDNDENIYYMTLKIAKLKAADIGDYYCQVENILGTDVKKTSLELRSRSEMKNITDCCIAEKVSPQCMSACSFYVDIDAVIDKTQCFSEFDKLMKCSSDGSDHRHCCAKKSVTRKCLNWCRGEVVTDTEMCALKYTRSIIGCFQENNNKLPGPPRNLKLIKISGESVSVSWDPPAKNPDMVEGYRVFWHTVDPMTAHNNQTLSLSGTSRLDAKETQIEINGLEQNVQYEMFIKAGNVHGASILSEALLFSLDDEISSPHSNNYGSVVGGILAIVIFLLFVIAILAYAKSKNLLKLKKASNGVAFENPSYLKESNIEQVTIQTISSNTQHNENPQSSTSANNHQNSTPNQTSSNNNAALREKNPNFIEQMKLKLGKKEGSKKLVP